MTSITSTFRMNHTMYRIKDPKRSLTFYQDILGMKLLRTSPSEAGKFTNYFLAFAHASDATMFKREGIVELCHNWGTEEEGNTTKYCTGNEDEHKGFGHIAITCDDIDATCKYFEDKGVTFKKKLTDGRMKDIAFILDPDGYWIELLANTRS